MFTRQFLTYFQRQKADVTAICVALHATGMERHTLSVTGMSCTGCEQNVESALKQIDGVTRVTADHEGDTVEIVRGDDVSDNDLHATIEQAGYDVPA